MPPRAATVTIHPSQFPEQIHRELVRCLRRGALNPKFLYDSVRQTQKWLALHAACSPARTDPDVLRMYTRSFKAAAASLEARRVHLVGLGCGGGTKDTRLLRMLQAQSARTWYTPCDVSTAMVLTARKAATAIIPEDRCLPVVCDLAKADNLHRIFLSRPSPLVPRLFTFFGMIPNFEPGVILPKLAALMRPRDLLLFSANLAPGNSYAAGMKRILPQYDNTRTRDWLRSFFLGLGVDPRDGELRFTIEADPAGSGLMRAVARYHFRRACEIAVGSDRIRFRRGRPLQLFFSYRHRSDRLPTLLQRHSLKVAKQWIAASEEEGVFLCRRAR